MEKLDYYLSQNKIPNLIFHGPPGSGKKTLLNQFIQKIYNKEDITQQVMYVNCAYGKGIKFIREDIKYFSKMNTHSHFKSVVLLNAEKLTPDAQFALRRCIEQFNYNTRFFIVTSDKYKLLKPILSRFSELYISSSTNLHLIHLNKFFPFKKYEYERYDTFKKIMKTLTPLNIYEISTTLYQNAYSVLDLEKYVEEGDIDTKEKYTWLLYSSKIRCECRDETLLLYMLLYFYTHRTKLHIDLFM
jgi:DNA polymerase III delta prime subunit